MDAPALLVAYFYHREKGVMTLVYRINDWAARNLAAKGFSPARRVQTREVTRLEADWLAGATRLHYLQYDSYAALVEDEVSIGAPESHLEWLRGFAQGHPLKKTD